MKSNIFPERLKYLRMSQNKSQKEFAEYLRVPQASMSAYENGKTSPTFDVLIEIANKCDVSMDWLCGRSDVQRELSNMQEVVSFFYNLKECNEIGFDIDIHDKLPNDIETTDNRWYVKLTFYGNDKNHSFNADVCNILREIHENYENLTSYAMSKQLYDNSKTSTIAYYHLPLTKNNFEKFALVKPEERQKLHIEYLKSKNML